MCGIFGVVTREKWPVQAKTLAALKTLEYRGYDSWGLAWSQKDSTDASLIAMRKETGKIGHTELGDLVESHAAIGHTRWATHGGVTVANAHPHLDCAGRIAMVHNGIVENFQELKAELPGRGHVWKSETDTEVIVHLIEELLKQKPFVEAVIAAFRRLTGLNAIVVLDSLTNEIVAIKRGSPLIIAQNQEGQFLASDAVALVPYSDQVHFMENEVAAVFSHETLKIILPTGEETQPVWTKLPFSEITVGHESYPDFLSKEINEQPAVLTAVLSQEPDIISFASGLTDQAIFIGCGTAYHTCIFATYIWALLAKRRFTYYIGSEFEHWRESVGSTDQPIFVSQSGETIDLIESAMFLKAKSIKVGAVVNRLGSTLQRLADTAHLLPAGPEMCVLATKSFTAKIATFLLAAASAGQQLPRAKADLQLAITGLQTILSKSFANTHIKSLASRLAHAQHIFVIGRGLSYPIALETAMKIKEVTYVHVEGFAGGELKHGTIALIEPGTPCIVIATDDETWSASISNAMEIKARGALVIGVSPKSNDVFDIHIPVPEAGLATCIGQTVAMQLLAYEMAKLLGKDVDKPRNLAKSVTVK